MKTQPLLLSLLMMLATGLNASAGTAFLEKGETVRVMPVGDSIRPPLSPFPVPPMTPPAKSKFLSDQRA
jgi:hypothetical protein